MTRAFVLRLALLMTLAWCMSGSLSVCAESCTESQLKAAIEQLRTLKAPTAVYIDDGAADGSVVLLPPDHKTPPLVEQLLTCPQKAGPLLVECLEDVRPTELMYQTQQTHFESRVVPLGYVCLDLLLVLSSSNTTINDDPCESDGFGACVKEGYYFSPDDYERTGSSVRALPVVHATKKAWAALLKSGRLTFHYPSWLKQKE